jgi:hypothetical protein
VHAYLDVSGSTAGLLPHLLALLLRPAVSRQLRVFQFSTIVEELPVARLRQGALETTYGTDIDPVLEHLLARPRVRRALLLTDGYTGTPRRDHVQKMLRRGVRLDVVMPAESAYEDDLREIAASITTLPALYPSSRGSW